MLKINSIQFGLIPYGPAIGQRSLLIEANNIKDKKKISETDEEYTYDLYDDFKSKLDKLEKHYIEAINGSSSVFLAFTGDFIKNDNSQELDEFISKISSESVKIQKSLKLTPDKIKPPFLVWVGTPKEVSSIRQNTGDVYQYFNAVYILLKSEKYNQLGVQQALNHQFSSICIYNDIDLALKIKNKYGIDKKISMISQKDHELVQEKCLQYNFRYYKYFNSQHVLKFK